MDIDLISQVSSAVRVPVIACGGIGKTEHAIDALQNTSTSAIAMGKALHTDNFSLNELRQACRKAKISVRDIEREQIGVG